MIRKYIYLKIGGYQQHDIYLPNTSFYYNTSVLSACPPTPIYLTMRNVKQALLQNLVLYIYFLVQPLKKKGGPILTIQVDQKKKVTPIT